MKRAGLYLVAAYLLTSAGCGHRPLPAALSVPAVTSREDALPVPAPSSMAIPLAVPLRLLQELVQERLAIPAVADWLQVTGANDSPEVAIRYEAQAQAIELALEGRLVRTTLPIRYFGSFRARANTPFGWIWLTKNTRWGSREQPGTIAIRVASQLSLSLNWQLGAQSLLEDVVLTAPDVDKLCAGKVFKVCVPIELARDRVHAELDKQVRARAASELAELDAQVAARADLQGLAQRVWGRLQAVHAGAGGQALALAPEAMSVSDPVLQGDALVIALNVWARPSWSVDAQAGGRALPAPAPRSSVPSELSLLLPLARETLGQRLTAALGTEPNEQGFRVSELALLGPAGAPGRWLWAARLSSESDSAWIYGESSLQSVGAGVRLSEVQVVQGAQALLAATGFGVEQLTQALSRPADLSADLEARVGELRAVLAASVSPWPVSPLQGVTLSVQAIYAAREGLVLSVLGH